MKKIILLLSLIFNFSFAKAQERDIQNINSVLNTWHKSAAEANFRDYFNAMTDDAIFIGTDATENWNKKDFQAYAKPHFDKGKAWNFKPMERHIYFSKDGKTAWFDELLNTQMKICRGSGVMVQVQGHWKISHYVLSMTIPNENTNDVVKIKTPIEDKFISELIAKKK
jgi:ketosteroid isomerase-like protein